MARLNQRELPADLVRAQERLAEWRRTKTPRSRIPESLWKMAVDLAAKHPLHRTARALNLDYYSLKKRCESAAERGDENGTTFLQLPPGLVPVPECAIEWEDSLLKTGRVAFSNKMSHPPLPIPVRPSLPDGHPHRIAPRNTVQAVFSNASRNFRRSTPGVAQQTRYW